VIRTATPAGIGRAPPFGKVAGKGPGKVKTAGSTHVPPPFRRRSVRRPPRRPGLPATAKWLHTWCNLRHGSATSVP